MQAHNALNAVPLSMFMLKDRACPNLTLVCNLQVQLSTHKKTSHDPFVLPSTHLQVLPIKGEGAADQRVEDDPQTPHIHLRPVILLSLEKLRRCVGGRPTERVQLVSQRELVAEAKISNLDVGVSVQQQVLRLNQVMRVRVRGIDGQRNGRRASMKSA